MPRSLAATALLVVVTASSGHPAALRSAPMCKTDDGAAAEASSSAAAAGPLRHTGAGASGPHHAAGEAADAAAETFWQITDTHVNMEYPSGCGDCMRGTCATFADYYCGSSPALYHNAVEYMRTTSLASGQRPPAFIAHTGDVPDVWNGQNGANSTFLHGTNAWQADTLAAAFPTTPLFFAFGNHGATRRRVGPPSASMPACPTDRSLVCVLRRLHRQSRPERWGGLPLRAGVRAALRHDVQGLVARHGRGRPRQLLQARLLLCRRQGARRAHHRTYSGYNVLYNLLLL